MCKVYKKECDQLKDEIVQILLLCVFICCFSIFVVIVLSFGLILVDLVSVKKVEDLFLMLCEVFGFLLVCLLSVKVVLIVIFIDWVKIQEVVGDFYVFDECELCDIYEDGGVVCCKCQDLISEEIQLYFIVGKLVIQLFLVWLDKLFFVFDDKLVVKCLCFEDLLQEQVEKDGGEDVFGQFDVSFILMMLIFVEFFLVFFEVFGGEEIFQGV